MRLVCGVGFNDLKGKTKTNGKQDKDYQLWRDMLRRTNTNITSFARGAYLDATCCNEWLVFSKFIADISGKIGYKNDGWHLDKDILIKGNKHYSDETTCFIPSEINNLFTKSNSLRGEYPIGVYFDKNRGFFRAALSVGGKNKNIGRFSDPNSAFREYKKHKESLIKQMAEKYKSEIDINVYLALINYEVSIND